MPIIVPASQVTTVTTGGTVTDTKDVVTIASIVVDLGLDAGDVNFLDGTLDANGVFVRAANTKVSTARFDFAKGTYELSGAVGVAVPPAPIPEELLTQLMTGLVNLGQFIETAVAAILTDTQGAGPYTTVPIVPTVPPPPPPA